MVPEPDLESVRHAYRRVFELTDQKLTVGMVLDELRHEGFSDDTIAAALKERLDLIARVRREVAARTWRVAAIMFVLGLIAWPITALFDFGVLEHGVVFGLIAGSAVVALRGGWHYLIARRNTLTETQVQELVANGKVTLSTTGSTPSLTRTTTIGDRNDQLEEARAHTDAAKRIKAAVWWVQLVAFIAGAAMIFESIDAHPMLAIFIGLPLFYLVLMKLIPGVVPLIGHWVEYGTAGATASGLGFTGNNKILTEVPRAPNLPIPSEEDVIRAEHVDTIAPTPTPSGGRTVEVGETETTIERDPEQLPPGILVVTTAGIAFYPNVDSPSDAAKKIAHSLLTTVSSVSPIAQVATELGLADALTTEDPELPLWMRRAREAKHHFVIPWPELTKVFYNPLDNRVTLIRELEDGTRKGFLFKATSDEWPEALMSVRFKYEMMATLRQFVELPRMREVLPELVEKFRGIYGDRIEEHWPEIVREAEERVAQQPMGNAIEVLMTNLADRLPYYGKYPKLRALYAPFFPDHVADETSGDTTADGKGNGS